MRVTSSITCCVAKLLSVFLTMLNELYPADESIPIATILIFIIIVLSSPSDNGECAQQEKLPQ